MRSPLACQRQRERARCWARASGVAACTWAAKAACVITAKVGFVMEYGHRDMLAVTRPLELCQPGTVGSAPGNTILCRPRAYPGGALEPHGICPPFAP